MGSVPAMARPPQPRRPPRRDGKPQGGSAKRTTQAGKRSQPPRDDPAAKAPKQWGSVARRGARVVGEAAEGTASEAWRKAAKEARAREKPPAPWQPEEWVEDDAPDGTAVRREATRAVHRGEATKAGVPARRRKAPPPVAKELAQIAGPRRAPRLEERLMEAARAFERERYQDARKVLRRLSEEAPAAASVRELYGLTLYRQGRWAEAAKELEAYRSLTGAVDQHPVLADCYRALGRHAKVAPLWEELREASPSGELVAEGRIVAAGSLADRGDVQGAIRLLEKAQLDVKRPKEHHLRLWYALADLYERAGDVPRARELFRRVAARERDFADVSERLSSLGS